MSEEGATPDSGGTDLAAVLRSPGYLVLLVLCAAIGIPVSALAYGYVQLFQHLQTWLFDSLPKTIGYAATPDWWPVPFLAVGGLLVGLTLRYLPGNGGHSPADGFSPGQPEVRALPGIIAASLASLAFGAVLGPEAPLIALGGGLGIIASRTFLRHASPMAPQVVGAAGAFASIGTIFGNPLVAAFFLMEGIGLGGTMLTLVLIPGLLSAGVGALIFIGLGRWTGLGSASLVLPGLPHFARPDLPQIGWAVVIGLVAAVLGWLIRSGALLARDRLSRATVWPPIAAGLVVAVMAVAFTEASGKPVTSILFSGQSFIGPLVSQQAAWTVGALLLLLVFKAIAYSVSLSSFRGGPVFPALLVGTAMGLVAAHLPGMSMVPGIAAGMGAMTASMLRLPLAAVMLPTLLLLGSGVGVVPLIIVAVVVAFLVTVRLPLPTTTAASHAPATGGASPPPAAPEPVG